MGHIELPVPVYHVIFINQLLYLLRARCNFCSRLKIGRDDVNRYTCKLRLIQYGLLDEAKELENIKLRNKAKDMVNGAGSETDIQSDDPDESDEDSLEQRRNDFVKLAIKKAGGPSLKAEVAAEKVEAITDERRAVVKEFLTKAPNIRACGSCKGYHVNLYAFKTKLTKNFPECHTRIGKISIARYFESL